MIYTVYLGRMQMVHILPQTRILDTLESVSVLILFYLI